METDHLSEFSHGKCWIFPKLCERLPDGKPPFSNSFPKRTPAGGHSTGATGASAPREPVSAAAPWKCGANALVFGYHRKTHRKMGKSEENYGKMVG